jgi:transposase-like protein
MNKRRRHITKQLKHDVIKTAWTFPDLPLARIADAFGVTRQSVSRWCKGYDLKNPGAQRN